MADGAGIIDFGATPTDEASVVVSGQAGIVAGSHVEAWFMREVTGDNGVEEHEQAAAECPLVCGAVVAGTEFTVFAHAAFLATGQFDFRWVWKNP